MSRIYRQGMPWESIRPWIASTTPRNLARPDLSQTNRKENRHIYLSSGCGAENVSGFVEGFYRNWANIPAVSSFKLPPLSRPKLSSSFAPPISPFPAAFAQQPADLECLWACGPQSPVTPYRYSPAHRSSKKSLNGRILMPSTTRGRASRETQR